MKMQEQYNAALSYYNANKEFFHTVAEKALETEYILAERKQIRLAKVSVEELFERNLNNYQMLAIDTSILPAAGRKHYIQSMLSASLVNFITDTEEENGADTPTMFNRYVQQFWHNAFQDSVTLLNNLESEHADLVND
jgi:hypothetical protein